MDEQQTVTPNVDMSAVPPAIPMTGDDVASEATEISKTNLDTMPTLASEPSEPEVAELEPEMPVSDPLPMPETDMPAVETTPMPESDMQEPAVAPVADEFGTTSVMEPMAMAEDTSEPEEVVPADPSETPQV